SDAAIENAAILPMTQFAITHESRSALARRLSLDFMDPIFKRDLAEKIDRLNEHGSFPGIESYAAIATETVPFSDYIRDWQVVLVEPDRITTSVAKFEALLRNEYEAAASKGRAVYAPDRVTTPGTDVLNFLGNARISFSEVHIGPLVIPSRKDGEESPAQARGGSLVEPALSERAARVEGLGMTIHAPQ